LAHATDDTSDRKGTVVPSGSGRTQAAVDKAESIAREVEGVTSVQNNIKVKKDDLEEVGRLSAALRQAQPRPPAARRHRRAVSQLQSPL
jgi:hypothetical protein